MHESLDEATAALLAGLHPEDVAALGAAVKAKTDALLKTQGLAAHRLQQEDAALADALKAKPAHAPHHSAAQRPAGPASGFQAFLLGQPDAGSPDPLGGFCDPGGDPFGDGGDLGNLFGGM